MAWILQIVTIQNVICTKYFICNNSTSIVNKITHSLFDTTKKNSLHSIFILVIIYNPLISNPKIIEHW